MPNAYAEQLQRRLTELLYKRHTRIVFKCGDGEEWASLQDLDPESGLYKEVEEATKGDAPFHVQIENGDQGNFVTFLYWRENGTLALDASAGTLDMSNVDFILSLFLFNRKVTKDAKLRVHLLDIITKVSAADETCLKNTHINEALDIEVAQELLEEPGAEAVLLPWIATWVAPGITRAQIERLPKHISPDLIAALWPLVVLQEHNFELEEKDEVSHPQSTCAMG